jgi:hypothetical protein
MGNKLTEDAKTPQQLHFELTEELRKKKVDNLNKQRKITEN